MAEGIFIAINKTSATEFRNPQLVEEQARRMWKGECIDDNIVYDRSLYTLEAPDEEYVFNPDGTKKSGRIISNRAPLYTGIEEQVEFLFDGITPNPDQPRTGFFSVYHDDGISNLRVDNIRYQQEGAIVGYKVYLGLSVSSVGVLGGSSRITPTVTAVYGRGTEIPVSGVSVRVVAQGTYWRNILTGDYADYSISDNKHTTTGRSFVLSASVLIDGQTYSSSNYTISQAGDSYRVDRIVPEDYDCSITKWMDAVTASGGYGYITWTAEHYNQQKCKWNSDGLEFDGARERVDDHDTASITESLDTYNGFSFTRSSGYVGHSTMGDNSRLQKTRQNATETARYTISNGGVSHYVDFSVTNYYTDNVSEHHISFQVQLGTTEFSVFGGTTSIAGKQLYDHHHQYSYTSGVSGSFDDGIVSTRDVTNRTTFSVSGTGAGISGTTLTISNNKHNESTRSFTVSGSWSGYSDTESVSQDKDYLDYVTRRNENYSCSISKDTYYSDIFTADGGRMYIKWVAGHDDATYYKWRSDNADYIVRIPVDDTNTATIEISTQTYPLAQSFKFFTDAYGREDKHIVTHENMSDNSRLSGRETTATERCTVRVTNNGVTNSVELDAVTNTYSGRIYETPTASLSVSEIYYTGASVPVMVGISQWSFARYSAGDYDRKQEGGSVLVSSFSGTAYSGGSKDGNSYVKASALSAARDRTRVYRISSATYTDLGGTSRTMSASYDVYQESLAVTATNLYEITKFTISGVTSKEIAWDYQGNLPIVTEGRMRTDTHYNAGGGRLEWDVTGTWDTPSGRAMGISATGATGFTIPSSTSTSGTASIGCSQNTGTSDRNMTVTASWGGQTATCTVSQAHRVSITLTLSANPSLRRATVSASAAVKSNVNIEASVTWILTTSPLTTQTVSYTVSIANGATSGYTTESSLRPVGYRAVHILAITPGAGDTTNYINGTP